jgi:methylenetetrahydrofolate dehydrogenase (NADP+)/methenyltetrahydrofolate cyclohydrolase/formyltetrahydrofolate synthetase
MTSKIQFNAIILDAKSPVPADIDVAHSVKLKPITVVARECGILDEELEPFGSTKAKVRLTVVDRLKSEPNGNYVVVTGMNPT